MHYAANGMVQHASGAINGLILVAWGAAGFDPRLCNHEQPQAARDAIDFSFLIGLPAMSLLTACCAWCYPIQGKRLQALRAQMESPAPPKLTAAGRTFA